MQIPRRNAIKATLLTLVPATLVLATCTVQAAAAAGSAPAVTTLPASGIGSSSATLTGTVNPGGLATTAWFQWGTLAKYTSSTPPASIPAGKTAVKVSATITGLTPATGYRFQVVAKNAKGTKYAGPATFTTLTTAPAVRPLSNDGSAGSVLFTFDDGPSSTSGQLMSTLAALRLPAVFFNIGVNVAGDPATVKAECASGYLVENHTWDHASLTGDSTGTAPLSDAAATAELAKASNAATAAGCPAPTLWRPPYGDINSHYNDLANSLGLRLVMPYGDPQTGNIVDSNDWQGLTAAQIVSDVTNGYTAPWYTGPAFFHGIQADSIIAMHDDGNLSTINSLQGIVDYMNAHHLMATAVVRPDATGGVLAFTNAVAKNAPAVGGQTIKVAKLGRRE
jgi:peptidoglycan/xylan/chitin deacetylase (PgdA/CDA1 family)